MPAGLTLLWFAGNVCKPGSPVDLMVSSMYDRLGPTRPKPDPILHNS